MLNYNGNFKNKLSTHLTKFYSADCMNFLEEIWVVKNKITSDVFYVNSDFANVFASGYRSPKSLNKKWQFVGELLLYPIKISVKWDYKSAVNLIGSLTSGRWKQNEYLVESLPRNETDVHGLCFQLLKLMYCSTILTTYLSFFVHNNQRPTSRP